MVHTEVEARLNEAREQRRAAVLTRAQQIAKQNERRSLLTRLRLVRSAVNLNSCGS